VFKKSAVKRTKYAGLQRNIRFLDDPLAAATAAKNAQEPDFSQ